MYDRSQTYAVEASSADLRHYLARLGRGSCCFSRCIDPLRRAVDLYVRCYNTRQMKRRKYLHYLAALAIFIRTLSLTGF
jgi:hypothetical protein